MNINFRAVAFELGCEPATVYAIAAVESIGKGFDKLGRVLLRFEGHKFRQFTNKEYDDSHPHLSYPYSKMKSAKHGRPEFNAAFKLDSIAAMKATSFGMFQIMGFNHELCGFEDIGEFVDFISKNETNQAVCMIRLMRSFGLIDALKNKDWREIANKWNGSDNSVNNYPLKLAAAYEQYEVGYGL